MLKQTPFATDRAATTSAIAASPWSPLVAVAGQNQVSLYHAETGDLLGVLPFPEGEPQSITFSRDGRLILVGGGKHSHSGIAALYEIATGNRITRVGDELDIVLGADISDDNSLIALAGPQKMVRVYSTMTGELKFEQKKHTDWIYTVRFSPDGLLLATGDRSGGLVVWESQSGRLYMDLQGHKGEVRSVTWRPDSAAVISSSMDGTLKMWDMNSGGVLKSWDAHPGGAIAVATCNDGTIVSTGRDNKVKVWDINGNAAGEMPALVEAGHEVAITVDGKQIAAGDWAGNVRLWQRANPADEKQLRANPLPLDQMLVANQNESSQLTTTVQTIQNNYTAQSTQQTALQQQLTDTQNQIAALTAQIVSGTEKHNALKPEVEQLSSQFKTKSDEFAPIQAARLAKQALVDMASANKKRFEDEVAAFKTQRAAEGADTATIDQKIGEAEKQISIQIAALQQLTLELTPIAADAVAREKQLAEWKPVLDAKTTEFNSLVANLAQWNTKKPELEKQIEPMTAALKAATDAANTTKGQLDASSARLAVVNAKTLQLQADIAAFANRPAELQQKKAGIDQSLTALVAQMQPVQNSLAETKGQMDAVTVEMAKLEQQMAVLQKQLADELAKKNAITTAMQAKQSELSQLQTQSQQLESDAANAALQMQIFEQSFGKK
jgi:WD40 repeat protein